MALVPERLRRSPGDYFFQTNLRRRLYKIAANSFCHSRVVAGKHLLGSLPATTGGIGANGYLILPPLTSVSELSIRAVEAATRIVAARSLESGAAHSEGFLRSILMPHDLIEHRAILQYGLSHELLSPVARYMGQVPVMPYIFIWRSLPSNKKSLRGSQLWHLDHSDTRQIKVFVFLEDVEPENGPLVLIPAQRSQQLRRKLNYNWHNRRRISDTDMYRLLDPDRDIVSITGAKGTVVLADTSRCFHYGSRLQKGLRHILLYRYLTYSNFLFNPFQNPPNYPLAGFATLPSLSALQKTVLTGVPLL